MVIPSAPNIDFEYGLAPNVEVDFTAQYSYNFPRHSDKEEHRADGIGDTEIAAILRFLKETPCLPEMAFDPIYTIPTGESDKDLGNGKPTFTLPIAVQKTFGPWIVYSDIAYTLNGAKGARNFYSGGIAFERDFDEKGMIGAELFAQGATSKVPADAATLILNVGGSYTLIKNLAFLASVGNCNF